MTEPLPTSINFGKVTGRIVHLDADTAADTDALPEARPADGKVTFTPRSVVSRVLGPEYTAIVLNSRVSALLVNGYLSDAEGRPGIWLAVGSYSVSFTVDGPAKIPGFDIEVTTDHTDLAPLDLAGAANVTPVTTVLQMVEIPFGGAEGQVLARTAGGGLEWEPKSSALDLPSHAGRRDHRFVPATSVYNLKASNTRRIRAALGAARAGTGLARLTFVGDSLTAGYSDVRGTNDAVTFLRNELARLGYAHGEPINLFSALGTDPRTTWGPGAATYEFPWSDAVIASAPTATISGSGTVFEMQVSTRTGAFTVSIDGGAPTPSYSWTIAEYADSVMLVSIDGLTPGPHTATITRTGGTPEDPTGGQPVYFYAAGFREAAGVVLQNAGMSGATANDWVKGASWSLPDTNAHDMLLYSSAWSLFSPTNADHDCVFIELGMNDRWQGVTPEAFKASMSKLIVDAQYRGATVVLVVSNDPQDGEAGSPTWGEFASAVYDLADTFDLPLLDLADRWGPFAEYNADGLARDLASDGVHLTAAGNAAKARAWKDLLTV